MCLRFAFRLIARVAAGLRLSRREEMWNRGDLDPAPPAQRAAAPAAGPAEAGLGGPGPLAALPGVMPKARRQGLRLLITPDTIVRWHRDIARRRRAARSACRRAGRPATRRNTRALDPAAGSREPRLGISQGPWRTGRTRHKGRSVYRAEDPQGQRHRPRPTADLCVPRISSAAQAS